MVNTFKEEVKRRMPKVFAYKVNIGETTDDIEGKRNRFTSFTEKSKRY